MEETMKLILLAIVMLVGSFLIGSIPLVMSMSEEKLKLISVLGAGLLVGTALAVIIPEGVRSLFSVETHVHLAEGTIKGEPIHSVDLHSLIGISLVLGFVFMLLVDQFSTSRSRDIEGGLKPQRNITATIGLVVHAAADGIALGAAATTAHTDVEMIVFVAIMLHKAPAAFGLVTFLLHEGLERNRIRKHLLIFSLAAPTLALLTYFGIGQEGKETLSSVNATGIAMLFSAGTFLFVATVHVLPELTARSHGHSHHSGLVGSSDSVQLVSGEQKGMLRTTELVFLIIGAILPLFLTLGHHH
ncbi:zinc transporter ZIP9 [Ischnura elegans]|uniref:zinc transporter ZIP9 n=1 Tax=Ischnura elegans TaxID=197161 RepID=UPI001ED87CE2|nr:zinc transporter ZIP9 [Ischnura elegans]